jgi:hypothetical protein
VVLQEPCTHLLHETCTHSFGGRKEGTLRTINRNCRAARKCRTAPKGSAQTSRREKVGQTHPQSVTVTSYPSCFRRMKRRELFSAFGCYRPRPGQAGLLPDVAGGYRVTRKADSRGGNLRQVGGGAARWGQKKSAAAWEGTAERRHAQGRGKERKQLQGRLGGDQKLWRGETRKGTRYAGQPHWRDKGRGQGRGLHN